MNADHFLLVSHIGNIVLTHSQDYSALDQVHFLIIKSEIFNQIMSHL